MTETEHWDLLQKRLAGFTGYCGVRIDEAADGFCRAHCDLEEHHLNPRGAVHGGMLCTLMDVAAGTAAISAFDPPRVAVTQSADIHYLRPAGGSRLRAEGRAVKAGHSVAFVQAEVFDDEDKLVAVGGFEFFYIEAPADKT